MGVRRFFLIIAVATTLVPDAAVRADVNYRAEITGAEDSGLADLLDKVSELKRTQVPKAPFPYEAVDVTYENKEAGNTLAEHLLLLFRNQDLTPSGPFGAALTAAAAR